MSGSPIRDASFSFHRARETRRNAPPCQSCASRAASYAPIAELMAKPALCGALLLLLAVMLPGVARADWLKTTEQEAFETYQAGDFEAAAETFSDPYRQGVSLYRAGRLDEAEHAFEKAEQGKQSKSARYNLGNTRFKRGDFTGAAAAYESVLREDPDHSDAAHNLAVTRATLARLEQEQFRDESEPEEDGESPAETAETREPESRPPPEQEQSEQQEQEQQDAEEQASEQQESEEQQQSDQQQESEQQQDSDQEQD
jgi:Ca-activated chloride channel homolog